MPQLNPEFFISQLFWLVVTFSFLFLFLWKISLPRISSVLEKRENKISNDLETAKQLQKEAEEIQELIDKKLTKAHEDNGNLIKKTIRNIQNNTTNELNILDKDLKKKIENASVIIKQESVNSLNQIHKELKDIVKLTLSKLSSLSVSNDEINESIKKIDKKIIN